MGAGHAAIAMHNVCIMPINKYDETHNRWLGVTKRSEVTAHYGSSLPLSHGKKPSPASLASLAEPSIHCTDTIYCQVSSRHRCAFIKAILVLMLTMLFRPSRGLSC